MYISIIHASICIRLLSAGTSLQQLHGMMMVRELLGATYPEIKVLACLCILWFGVRAAFA